MRHLILALLFGLAPALPAAAQTGGEAVVADIQNAYREFDYEVADSMGREALRRYSDFTVGQLTVIHTTLGLVAYDRGDLNESRRQFISALQLSPDLELDPILISPKIVEFFGGIKADLAGSDASVGAAPARYVILADRRTDAAVRSMVLPGWGQFYKGHHAKGWIISTVFAATGAGALAAHLKRRDAEKAYTGETDPDLIAGRYETFNRWHKTRNGLIQGAAVVWAAGFVDALFTHAAFSGDQSRLTVGASPTSVSLALRF